MWIRNNLFWIREFVEFRIRILVYVFSIFEKLKKRIVINQKEESTVPSIEEGWREKQRQRSSRLFEGRNLFNFLPRYLFCLGRFGRMDSKSKYCICHFQFHSTVLPYSSPEYKGLKFRNTILVYMLFPMLAGSGTIIPNPDPAKSFRSDRIRIHNTGRADTIPLFICIV